MAILNFQKPDKIILQKATDFEAQFEFRPLEPGYGVTIGNALRRVLLSSLEGYSITGVKIEGVDHEFATINVDIFRRDTRSHGGVALRFDLDMTLTITAEIIYDVPRALLLACMHAGEAAAAVPPTTVRHVECCSVCMEDFAAREDTVRLPCSHAFHRDCISPWFHKATTCPMCRHDISRCLAALTNTPKGKFPGIGT
jgi:hypothetical protein